MAKEQLAATIAIPGSTGKLLGGVWGSAPNMQSEYLPEQNTILVSKFLPYPRPIFHVVLLQGNALRCGQRDEGGFRFPPYIPLDSHTPLKRPGLRPWTRGWMKLLHLI